MDFFFKRDTNKIALNATPQLFIKKALLNKILNQKLKKDTP